MGPLSPSASCAAVWLQRQHLGVLHATDKASSEFCGTGLHLNPLTAVALSRACFTNPLLTRRDPHAPERLHVVRRQRRLLFRGNGWVLEEIT